VAIRWSLTQKPDFADLFVAIGRLGRSLQIHLLLASQRLEEGKLRGLDSHLSYRVGLRTFSASESRAVLGVPDAYELPSVPGSGYLKFHTSAMVRFKTAYVSGLHRVTPSPTANGTNPVTEDRRPRVFLAERTEPERVSPAPTTDPRPALPALPPPTRAQPQTLLDVIVARVRGQGPPAHEVWLPPLDVPPTLDQLLPPISPTADRGLSAVGHAPNGTLSVPLGVVDKPFEQRRDLLWVDLSAGQGHVAVLGGPQSGKSTALRTLIVSTALTHTPAEVQFYCLDFGGGTLAGLDVLPHVGSVAGRGDADLVRRTVAELSGVVRARERRFRDLGVDSMAGYRALRRGAELARNDPGGGGGDDDPYGDDPYGDDPYGDVPYGDVPYGDVPYGDVPYGDVPYGDVFLVIDGWLGFRTEFEAHEQQVMNLAAHGLSYGVHLVLGATRWAELRPALKDLLGTRLELRLGDPSESDVDRKLAVNVPQGRPGRGLSRDRMHMLLALPRIDSTATVADIGAGLADAVAQVAAAWAGPVAPAVRVLPELVTYPALLALTAHQRAERSQIPVGVDEDDLAPAYLDFDAEPHLVVYADGVSGKTALLRLICTEIVDRNTPEQAKLLIGDYRRTLLGVVDSGHLAGYAASAQVLTTMLAELVVYLGARLPGPGVTQEQLRTRSWWSGPEIYVLIDDYDLVAHTGANPVAQLVDLLGQAKDVGLHLVVARRSGGASRALFEPVLSRLRDLASPGLVMSGNRDEGNLVGAVRPCAMPPGRGTLVSHRAGQRLVQVAWQPPP